MIAGRADFEIARTQRVASAVFLVWQADSAHFLSLSAENTISFVHAALVFA